MTGPLITFAICALLFTLTGWLLWKATREDPDEFERQATEFRDAARNLKRELGKAFLPPVEWLARKLSDLLERKRRP